MCFCSLACGQGAGRPVGWRQGQGTPPTVAARRDGAGRCTHEQVDGQLGLPEAVNKLGLGGGPCSQREDALWTGGWRVSLAGPSLPRRVWPPSSVPHPLRLGLAPLSGHWAPHLHSCVRPDAPPLSGAPHPLPRTCRPLLPLLLSLLALVQLLESLRSLLQPSHEPLDVVQGAVEDLLGSEQGQGSASGAPPAAGTPPPAASWPLAWPQEPGVGGRSCRPETHRLLLDLLSQHGPRFLVLRLPTAKACSGAELLLTEPPHPNPAAAPSPSPSAHLGLRAAWAGPLGSWWRASPCRGAGRGWGSGPGPGAGRTAAAGSSPGGP